MGVYITVICFGLIKVGGICEEITLTVTFIFTIQSAAEWTLFGCFWTNGQICSATSRLIVHVSMEEDY